MYQSLYNAMGSIFAKNDFYEWTSSQHLFNQTNVFQPIEPSNHTKATVILLFWVPHFLSWHWCWFVSHQIYVAVDVEVDDDVDLDVDGDVDVPQIGALQHWQRNGKTSVACGAASRWGEHVQHGRGVDDWCNGNYVFVKRWLYNYGDNDDDASDNDGGDNDDYDGNDDDSAKNNSSNKGGDDDNFEVKSKASNKV